MHREKIEQKIYETYLTYSLYDLGKEYIKHLVSYNRYEHEMEMEEIGDRIYDDDAQVTVVDLMFLDSHLMRDIYLKIIKKIILERVSLLGIKSKIVFYYEGEEVNLELIPSTSSLEIGESRIDGLTYDEAMDELYKQQGTYYDLGDVDPQE